MRWVGAIWALPIAAPIWILVVLPMWALGLWEVAEKHPWAIEFRSVKRGPIRRKLWSRAKGLSFPFAFITRDLKDDDYVDGHELGHNDQWMILGPLFPIVYAVLLLVYGYFFHPMELDANRRAMLKLKYGERTNAR